MPASRPRPSANGEPQALEPQAPEHGLEAPRSRRLRALTSPRKRIAMPASSLHARVDCPLAIGAASSRRSPPAASDPPRARRAAPARAVTRVEVVRPERQTVRRSVGEPGQLQAFETTAIHAKIPGYVKKWTVNIGDHGQEGPGARRAVASPSSRPRPSRSRRRSSRRSPSTSRPRPRSRWPRPTSPAPRRSSTRSGPASSGPRPTSPAGRPSIERVEQLFHERAQTGSLLDETRSKLQLVRGGARGGRGPGQDGRGGREPEPGRARQGPLRRRPPPPPPSRSPGPTPGASRPCSATPGSRPPSTASSPGGTSTPAT